MGGENGVRRGSGRQRPTPTAMTGRIVAGIAALGVLVVAGISGVIGIAATSIEDSITVIDVTAQLGPSRPEREVPSGPTGPLNILVMGSDTRDGQGAGYGKIYGGSARSDTTILLHITGDRRHAMAVSIPRDSYVTIPDCTREDGSTIAGRTTRINEAFTEGGPACTIKTIEALTGVFIDHYVVVDFRGFKTIVEALGGVEVCLEEAVDDPKSKLKLPAGTSVISGEQALAFVRARNTLADGSDLRRIDRQQAFLGSMARKALSLEILANPLRLYETLTAVAGSLTTDPGFGSVDSLAGLGYDLRGLSATDIIFLDIPVATRSDGATVEWLPGSRKIWQAINKDKVWPPEFADDLTEPAPSAAPDPNALKVAPADITVDVLNGTATAGLAADLADALAAQGYRIGEVGNATTQVATQTVVYYRPGDGPSARTLVASLGGDVRRERSASLGEALRIVVGSDAPAVVPVTAPKPKPSPSPTEDYGDRVSTADQVYCAS